VGRFELVGSSEHSSEYITQTQPPTKAPPLNPVMTPTQTLIGEPRTNNYYNDR